MALLRASRYHAVVHLDARHGLAEAIHTWLAAADPAHEPSATHGQALQRLAGAMRGHRTLIVLTHADATSVDLARAALREHAMVAAVQPRIRAAFAVCHHIDRSDWGAWAADQLKSWPLGAFATAWTSGPSLVLALRQALAMARSVIVLGGQARGEPGAWAVAERARDRIAALLIGDAMIPHGAEALSWTRLSPDDEQAARDQLLQAAENLAGPRPARLTRLDDTPQTRGELDEALRIYREEELPVYERLGARHDLLVARANMAITYLARNDPADRDEAAALLRQALADATVMGIPEADQIRAIMTAHGIDP